jgi:hypothetical protein
MINYGFNVWPRNDSHIESVKEDLWLQFSMDLPRPESLTVTGFGEGDSYGRERIDSALSKPRLMTSYERLDDCGPDLLFHISADGLAYYLPCFLHALLDRREFGWFEEALLPSKIDYLDVLNQFSSGVVEWEVQQSARLGALNNSLHAQRVKSLHSQLSDKQRECVARYIEIAYSYRVKNPDLEFLRLLVKYADFWRSEVVN